VTVVTGGIHRIGTIQQLGTFWYERIPELPGTGKNSIEIVLKIPTSTKGLSRAGLASRSQGCFLPICHFVCQ
jgi:hypothetical protein